MKKQLRFKGRGMSDFAPMIAAFVFAPATLLYLALYIMFSHFFPFIAKNEWLAFLPMISLVGIMLSSTLSYFYTVTANENEVTLYWLFIPVRKISAKDLKLFCAIKDQDLEEGVLCLSKRTVEEMANLQEKHLLKNYFTKYDVPIIKRKENFKDDLATRYLNRIRRKLFCVFYDRQAIFICMNSASVCEIKKLYPHLIYKNYTGISKYQKNRYESDKTLWNYPTPRDDSYTQLQDGTVVFLNKKRIKSQIHLKDVKTVVRVDIFVPYSSRHIPSYLPVFYLSVLSPKELAEKTPLHNDQTLDIYEYALKKSKRRLYLKGERCNIICSESNETQLKEICKDACWIDISDSWITSSP